MAGAVIRPEVTQVWEHPLGLLSPDALSEGCKDTKMMGALLLCPARLGPAAWHWRFAPQPAVGWGSLTVKLASTPDDQVPACELWEGCRFCCQQCGFASLLLLRAMHSTLLRARMGRSDVFG